MLEPCNFKVLANNFLQFLFTGLAADLRFKICTPVIILMLSTCIKSLLIIASGGSVPVYSRVLLWGYILIIGIFDMADVVLSRGFAKESIVEYFCCMKNYSTLYMFAHCGKKCIQDGRLLTHEIDIADIHTRDKKWVEINARRLVTLYSTYAFFITLWFVYSSLTPYEHGDCVLIRLCSLVFVWFAVSTCSSTTEGCRKCIRFVIKEETLKNASPNRTWVAEVQPMWPVDVQLPRSTSLATEGTVAFFFSQSPFYPKEQLAIAAGVNDFVCRSIFIGTSVKYDHKYEPLVLIPNIHQKFFQAELGMMGMLLKSNASNSNDVGYLHLQQKIYEFIRGVVIGD